ncbi:MAG: response regulator [Archangiaceae bacterium]|nr:response regulator [Archangiaceae bacterium]
MAKIWIVEDSALDAQRAGQALGADHHVELLGDGSIALERLSNGQRPDVMVLDQVMPGVSGLEVLRFMRSEGKMQQVPVLLLTSRGAAEQIVEGLSTGANDYLPKPYAQEELRARVAALLRSASLLERAVAAESTLSSLLASVPDAVLAFDAHGSVKFANAEAEKVFGRSGAELLRQPLSTLLPGFDPRRRGSVLPDLRLGARIFSPSLSARLHDGGQLTTLVLRDVTDRREAEERRLDFYSIIAHDLRSPLSAMMLRNAVLRSGRHGPLTPAQEKETSRFETSMRGMVGIIDDFLQFARLQEGGAHRLERGELDLAQVAEATIDELRPLAEAGGLTLELGTPPPTQPVVGDRARLRQVVANLVGNAIKFTPPGGRIIVRTEEKPGALRTGVTDTGPGIAPDSVPELFNRFTRARSGSAKVGSGLGLMIVRQIVEAHGGKVGVDTAVGQGSTFWFTLPR